jgi:hypothetical protein
MTRRAQLLALATLFTLGAAAPAFAVWMPVTQIPLDASGSVNIVDAGATLPDRVEALSFRANNTDVVCRSVDGIFRSGMTMKLFSGVMPAGQENVIYMIPVHRDIARVDLHCRAAGGGAGDIQIAADIPASTVIVPAR